jgi:uncharacterized protein (DUF934 family)
MRRILKRRELIEDDWRYPGEEGTAETDRHPGLIVPFADFRTHSARWRAHQGRLGLRLSPADAVEDLAGDIGLFSLIAIEFPTPGEGRGYSQARLLRSRFAFDGELRAVGAAVKQDLLFIMSRCGFDSFELAPGQQLEAALAALSRYTVAYQPAAPVPSIQQQRFFAAGRAAGISAPAA